LADAQNPAQIFSGKPKTKAQSTTFYRYLLGHQKKKKSDTHKLPSAKGALGDFGRHTKPCADIFGKTENKEAKHDSLPLFDRLLKKKKVRLARTTLCQGSVRRLWQMHKTLRRYFRENRKQRHKAQPFIRYLLGHQKKKKSDSRGLPSAKGVQATLADAHPLRR